MPENIYLRALIVVAVTFVVIQGTAWLIRQIYYVINDLDNWAIWMLNHPVSAAGFAIKTVRPYISPIIRMRI